MDHEALLVPISDGSPCGEDLSFSPEFDAIQELRRADDPTLPQGEWVTALKSADWSGVRAMCTELLAQRSKDLRLAGWLTEASARLDGFGGLADGLALCHGLCERHWAGLHPRDDEGDDERQAGALRWLLAQVEALVPGLPVLTDGERTFCLRDIEAARASAGSGGQTPGSDDIAEACRATPAASLAAVLEAARHARDALARLEHVVDAQLGAEGPSFAGLRRALDDAVDAIGRLARAGQAPDEGGPTAGIGLPDVSVASPASIALGTPLTRVEALQQLRQVAAYFRRTEPHSPVAYLAERAARWGEMPLHAWLRAVVKDPGTLSQMEELLGIDPAADGA